MFSIIINLCAFFLTIGFVVGLHELGHFLAAKWLNVKVLRFSIGFGKPLRKWVDRQKTEYSLALIPLGGYVKLLDEEEEEVDPFEQHRAFNRQPFFKKALIVSAGPFCNLLFAFFAYCLIFMIGFTTIQPKIGKILPHSIAAEAGLKKNQIITSIDGKETLNWPRAIVAIFLKAGDQGKMAITTRSQQHHYTHTLDLKQWKMNSLNPNPLMSLGVIPYHPDTPLIIEKILPSNANIAHLKKGDEIIALNHHSSKNWKAFVKEVRSLPSQTVPIQIKRQGRIVSTVVTVGSMRHFFFQKQGTLGIRIQKPQIDKTLLMQIKYSPWSSGIRAYQEMVDLTYFNFALIGKLLIGKISFRSVMGPISIFTAAGNVLALGLIPFLNFLALISLSIGIANLLPIPTLDGGHLLFFSIEAILRRPISLRVKILVYRLGLIFVLFVLIQTVLNDLLRFVS